MPFGLQPLDLIVIVVVALGAPGAPVVSMRSPANVVVASSVAQRPMLHRTTLIVNPCRFMRFSW